MRIIRLLSLPLLVLYVASFSSSCSKAPDSALSDIHGNPVAPLSCADCKASVLIFGATECPISNSYAPEIKRIAEAYREHAIKITFVHVDPDLSDSDAAKHAKDYGLDTLDSIVVDRQHELVKRAQATITPEVAIFTPGGTLAYRGRINNRYAAFGDRRTEATIHDLRDALDAILAGEAVVNARTEAIGCYIDI